jgi:hypothetical protein
LRAWAVLPRLPVVLSELDNLAIELPPKKTFEVEGAI